MVRDGVVVYDGISRASCLLVRLRRLTEPSPGSAVSSPPAGPVQSLPDCRPGLTGVKWGNLLETPAQTDRRSCCSASFINWDKLTDDQIFQSSSDHWPLGGNIKIIMTSKASVRQFSRPVTASAFLPADRIQDILSKVKGTFYVLSSVFTLFNY